MREFFMCIAFCILFVAPFGKILAASDEIAVIVGKTAISKAEAESRARLLIISAGAPNTAQTRTMALEDLITESIQIKAAKEAGLEPDPQEVESAFAQIAHRNKFTPEQFRMAMEGAGIAPKALKSRLEAELAWSRFVEKTIISKVSVSQSALDSALAKATAKAKEKRETPPTRAMVSEVLLRAEVERMAAARMRELRARTFIERR